MWLCGFQLHRISGLESAEIVSFQEHHPRVGRAGFLGIPCDEADLAGPLIIQSAQNAGDPGEKILSAVWDEPFQWCGISAREAANNLGEQSRDSRWLQSGKQRSEGVNRFGPQGEEVFFFSHSRSDSPSVNQSPLRMERESGPDTLPKAAKPMHGHAGTSRELGSVGSPRRQTSLAPSSADETLV